MKAVQLNNGNWVRYCDSNDEPSFPVLDDSLIDSSGLLQVGGALTPEWLLLAYQHGIFPWFNENDPILWWSPDPRTVLFPQDMICRRSLAKVIRNAGFRITSDMVFDEVIRLCAETRLEQGTWIVPEMQVAYRELHRLGYAHSIEVWRDERLVGGLYGLHLGKVFFGESMFALESNASKVALYHLSKQLNEQAFEMIDCQFATDHLHSLGAVDLARKDFLEYLAKGLTVSSVWHFTEQ